MISYYNLYKLNYRKIDSSNVYLDYLDQTEIEWIYYKSFLKEPFSSNNLEQISNPYDYNNATIKLWVVQDLAKLLIKKKIQWNLYKTEEYDDYLVLMNMRKFQDDEKKMWEKLYWIPKLKKEIKYINDARIECGISLASKYVLENNK